MAFPTLLRIRYPIKTLTMGFGVVFRNHRIDRDRHIRDATRQKFFLNETSAPDRIGFRIEGVGDQPCRMGQNSFTVFQLERLHRLITEIG